MKDTLHRIWSMVVKEFLQLSRDKVLMVFVLAAPLLELLLMGTMTGDGVKNLPLAVIDNDRSRASRELISMVDQSDELLLKEYVASIEEAQALMQRGKIAAIVVIPPGYGQNIADLQRSAEVQIIVDDSNHIVARVAETSLETIAGEIMHDLTAHLTTISGGPVNLSFVARFNAALDDRPHSITAMMGMIVYQVTLVIAAQSFTRERERGTLEQLRITPMGRLEMILGKAIPTLVVGLLNCLLMIGFIAVWFDVPMRGSLPLLLVLTIPFVLAQIGWGTLISLVSRTQQQAILFVFALAMLEVACSGFIVSTSDMPIAMQVVASVSSVQHYLIILRGIMLRGAGLGSLWVPALALSGIAVAATSVAWLRLRVGLGTDSLQRRLRAMWQAYQERQRRQKTTDRRLPREPGQRPTLVPQPVRSRVEPVQRSRRRRY
jgi:ABC-2 type transport system permease protein